ncbi:hypothetical protein TB1_029193 [Malus domestica]
MGRCLRPCIWAHRRQSIESAYNDDYVVEGINPTGTAGGSTERNKKEECPSGHENDKEEGLSRHGNQKAPNGHDNYGCHTNAVADDNSPQSLNERDGSWCCTENNQAEIANGPAAVSWTSEAQGLGVDSHEPNNNKNNSSQTF